MCQWFSKTHANTHPNAAGTHTHTFSPLSQGLYQRQVYGSIEGTGRELSLSVELMKPGPTGIKEWRELALRSFTHSLTSSLYTAPDEVMHSPLKGLL